MPQTTGMVRKHTPKLLSQRSPIHFRIFFPHEGISFRSQNCLLVLGQSAGACRQVSGETVPQDHISQKGGSREEKGAYSALIRRLRPPPGTGRSRQHRMPIHREHQWPLFRPWSALLVEWKGRQGGRRQEWLAGKLKQRWPPDAGPHPLPLLFSQPIFLSWEDDKCLQGHKLPKNTVQIYCGLNATLTHMSTAGSIDSEVG